MYYGCCLSHVTIKLVPNRVSHLQTLQSVLDIVVGDYVVRGLPVAHIRRVAALVHVDAVCTAKQGRRPDVGWVGNVKLSWNTSPHYWLGGLEALRFMSARLRNPRLSWGEVFPGGIPKGTGVVTRHTNLRMAPCRTQHSSDWPILSVRTKVIFPRIAVLTVRQNEKTRARIYNHQIVWTIQHYSTKVGSIQVRIPIWYNYIFLRNPGSHSWLLTILESQSN